MKDPIPVTSAARRSGDKTISEIIGKVQVH